MQEAVLVMIQCLNPNWLYCIFGIKSLAVNWHTSRCEKTFKWKAVGTVKHNWNASEDPVKATMRGSEVLKTGCRREKAGQRGYWKGMTGYCTTVGKCMETISFILSMHSTLITLIKRDWYFNQQAKWTKPEHGREGEDWIVQTNRCFT